jgi:hypothetical protein
MNRDDFNELVAGTRQTRRQQPERRLVAGRGGGDNTTLIVATHNRPAKPPAGQTNDGILAYRRGRRRSPTGTGGA